MILWHCLMRRAACKDLVLVRVNCNIVKKCLASYFESIIYLHYNGFSLRLNVYG